MNNCIIAREERIANEVTVDAYDSVEVMTGWLTYLQDNLSCPFEAECIEQRKISPLRKGEKVTVYELLSDDDDIGNEFVVLIEGGTENGCPTHSIKTIENRQKKQTIEDWQYWKARGYEF